jgi:hypothetical protein
MTAACQSGRIVGTNCVSFELSDVDAANEKHSTTHPLAASHPLVAPLWAWFCEVSSVNICN